ncbi:MAG: hypothetical protein M3388_19395 [Acidobacteriota bacterium]|nr:hypothetical protein [Acidobacteriota bacterium]
MLRKWIAKFNKSITERVVSVRHNREVPIKLSFEPSRKTGKLNKPPQVLYITGETKDLSVSGIAFIVSSIRIKENYLVDEGRPLNAELDLPGGKVSMKIVGQRYEPIENERLSAGKYLVGASILQMTDENREVYEYFLRFGDLKENTGSLKFGINES